MARQKSRQSSSKEQHLGKQMSLRERIVHMEDATTNYRRSNSYSSETLGLYIEDEEIGNASIFQESTEYEVSLTSSIDISAAEMLRFRKSRVPSWSDSSGSTYVSGELQMSPQHSFKDSVKSEDDWSTNDSNNLDIMLQTTDMEGTNSAKENRITRKLEGIPYYPAVEETSSNTSLSAIESLQKGTAHSIFCKRLVPLLIPERSTDEDISAVSIAEDPPESVVNTRSKRQGRSIERLENVEYLPSIEIATDNEDISTVAYRMPYTIAHQAFGRSKKAIQNSMELPRLIMHSNSHSTVSTLESNSDLESESESYGDLDSKEATRQPPATSIKPKSKFQNRSDRVRDLEEGLSTKGSNVSSSDARIRELKKKIRQLKIDPKPKTERPPESPERGISHPVRSLLANRTERSPIQGREQRNPVPADMDSISKKIHELTRVAKDQRRRRAGKFVDDPTGGLAHSHRLKHCNPGRSRGDFASQEVRISEEYHSLAFGRGEFPIVIHHTRQDDISAMHDQSDTCQASDIETALRSALVRKREKTAMKSREAREKFKGAMIDYVSRGKDIISSTMKESTKGELKSSVQQTWESCTEGRSVGEKILIISVSIALLVLFILLIVVLAGR